MRYVFFVYFVFLSSLGFAQEKQMEAPANLPAKKSFWLFLLVGQSNMAGRGNVEPADTVANSHVLTLNKDGVWELAKDPVHFDKVYAGVGPGFTFGKMMAMADTNVYIGLIPSAVGGSSINSWQPANGNRQPGKNYQSAIERCKKAMEDGLLKGILWNQGETDCTEKGIANYQQKLENTIAGFRKDFIMPDLVFIGAELPAFQKQKPDSLKQLQYNPYIDQMNSIITDIGKTVPNFFYITSENTQHKGDLLHYDAASARLMGTRYATMMLAYLKKVEAFKK